MRRCSTDTSKNDETASRYLLKLRALQMRLRLPGRLFRWRDSSGETRRCSIFLRPPEWTTSSRLRQPLVLDNFAHISLLQMMTPKIAQISLRFGADDIDGTWSKKRFTTMGSDELRRSAAERSGAADRRSGREPIERDTLYRPVTRNGNSFTCRCKTCNTTTEAQRHGEKQFLCVSP